MELKTGSYPLGLAASQADALPLKSEAVRSLAKSVTARRVAMTRDAVETLIPDSRAELSPAQSVERKLTSMLRGATIPVSHIRLARLCGKR